jgi:hypothetical protein
MSDWHVTRKVKARKAHCCGACGTRIDPGEDAVYEVGRFDGSFVAHHLHPLCQQLWNASIDMGERADFPDCMEGWLQKHLDAEEASLCMKAARSYWRAGARK